MGGGGAGEELCLTKSAIGRFRSRIKEMNHKKNDKSYVKEVNISICRNGGQPCLPGARETRRFAHFLKTLSSIFIGIILLQAGYHAFSPLWTHLF